VYGRETRADADTAKVLTMDGARRIAVSVACAGGEMSRRKRELEFRREVYRLRQEGCSFEEIAKRLEIPVTTAKIQCQLGEQDIQVEQQRKERDTLLKKYEPKPSKPRKYTLDDLKQAEETLVYLEERGDSYRGNNPNTGRGIETARLEVSLIKDHLRAAGILPPVPPRPPTEKELLEKELDEAFPNAQSKQIVTHKGQKYQRRFWPFDKSRSGKTVHVWTRSWIKIDEVQGDD
jgi:hypothetical protein